MPIEIHDLQSFLDVDLALIERAALVAANLKDAEISIAIVDDEAIRAVNADHLHRDRPTDVIAFNYDEEESIGPPCGEVIVSAEMAKRVAEKEDRDPGAELILYVVHGVLHLTGMDDRAPDDAERMWEKQNEVMGKLGFTEKFKP
jgi:probable rRNA maturation factor